MDEKQTALLFIRTKRGSRQPGIGLILIKVKYEVYFTDARMAELVYAHDLKSCLERDVGSIPTPGTKAPIVQRIEHRPPKLEMLVRFQLEAQHNLDR